MEFESVLLYDAPHQHPLPPSVSVKIELTLGDPRMFLLSTAPDRKYRLDLRDLFLAVKRVKTQDLPMPRTLQYAEHEIVVETIPMGSTTFKRQIANMNTPRRIVAMMLTEKAFEGRYHLAPFQYSNFGLSSLQLQLLPSRYLPPVPMEFDWEHNFGSRALYAWFFENMKHALDDSPFDLQTMEKYKMYMAWDLTRDRSAGD